MFKRIMILTALAAVMAAIAILRFDVTSIEVPFFGIVSVMQLLMAALVLIAVTLMVTLASGFMRCGW